MAVQHRPEQSPAVANLAALAGHVPVADRTLDQVRRQLAAFGGDSYEVQPIPPRGSGLRPERIRILDAAQVERSVGWLKRMNALGYDIYIRPAPLPDGIAEPLAFVDDLNGEQVKRMRLDGLPFAALVESSKGRYHGWVRVADHPIPTADLTATAKLLAARYGGDINSADWRHYGRLCGFTNRKPSRATSGNAPFAMLRSSHLGIAPRGIEALAEARRNMVSAENLRRTGDGGVLDHRDLDAPIAAFQIARSRASGSDESAKDFAAALSLLRRGFSPEEVAASIMAASPDLAERHRNAEDYVSRTVTNAVNRIDVSTGPRLGR